MDEIFPIYGVSQVEPSFSSPGADTGIEHIRTLRESLTKAVRTVNQANFTGEGREVTFSLDPVTKRPVVKVVETKSQEVVAQWPSNYLLRVAEELKQSERNSR